MYEVGNLVLCLVEIGQVSCVQEHSNMCDDYQNQINECLTRMRRRITHRTNTYTCVLLSTHMMPLDKEM